jgi:hypothetical protein
VSVTGILQEQWCLVLGRCPTVATPLRLLDIGQASLPGDLSKTISGYLSVTFIHALSREVAELMGKYIAAASRNP